MPSETRQRLISLVQRAFEKAAIQHDKSSAKDINLARQRRAVETTAVFIDEHMDNVKAISAADPVQAMLETIRDAMRHVAIDGLTVEFGVATGRTLRTIADHCSLAYGFDSFEGLPEDWRPGYEAGHFAQEPPDVPGAEYVVGWFHETLPGFLVEHPEPFAYVHLDSDLYSSAKTILDLAFDRLVPGTVITFDEFFNFPAWQFGEYKAFMEFLERYDGGFEYLNYNAVHEQVSVRLT